jgi:hypothetical protein
MPTEPRNPTRRPNKGVDQETGKPGRNTGAYDASADPGTNRTHPLPDDSAERGPQDVGKHSERSPYTAGNQ